MKKQNNLVFLESKSSTEEGYAMSGDDRNTSESKNLTFNKLAFSFAVIVFLYYTVCTGIHHDLLIVLSRSCILLANCARKPKIFVKRLGMEKRSKYWPPPSPAVL